MWPSIRYVLLCSLRDRLFVGLALGILAITGLSAVLGKTALIENQEMTLTLAAAAARLIVAIGLIVFICFHIRSAFDNREMDVLLTRPISRVRIVLAYWCGFAIVAALLLLPVMAALLFIKPLSWPGFGVWMLTLLVESWLIVAVCLFCALLLNSAVIAVLAALGFYVLARMMAFFVMASKGTAITETLMYYAAQVVKGISIIVPRLDFFAQTEWLVYGLSTAPHWPFALLQAAIFIPLLLVAAIIDFRRREF